MSSKLLERGLRVLERGLTATASVKVDVVNGDHVLQALDATPGNPSVEAFAVGEVSVVGEPLDWFVAADELFFPTLGKKCEPESGWLIRWTQDDGRVLVFDVLPSDASGKCFKSVGRLGTMYRIHSKFKATEMAGSVG